MPSATGWRPTTPATTFANKITLPALGRSRVSCAWPMTTPIHSTHNPFNPQRSIMSRSPIIPILLGLAGTVAHGQQSARLVKYHTNDIVSVHAKMRYTTLIQLPATEKILEVATGDKDFWIIDTVGNYCFLHPAKEGIHSNLNLITDKGSVYSFRLY